MITNKQLDFVLGEVQQIQRDNIGLVGISIMTGFDTTDFAVTVNYNFGKDENDGSITSEYDTFVFGETMTEDQCVDTLGNIENIIKEEKKKKKV